MDVTSILNRVVEACLKDLQSAEEIQRVSSNKSLFHGWRNDVTWFLTESDRSGNLPVEKIFNFARIISH